jgi:hypothetical protein
MPFTQVNYCKGCCWRAGLIIRLSPGRWTAPEWIICAQPPLDNPSCKPHRVGDLASMQLYENGNRAVVLPMSEVRRIAGRVAYAAMSSMHARSGISAMSSRSLTRAALIRGRWLA